jgi:hypothetical protein
MLTLQGGFVAYRHLARKRADPNYDHRTNIDADDLWNIQAHLRYLHNQRFMATKSGRLGVTDFFAKAGDICFVVPGISNPLILRQTSQGTYNFVGAAYIHGVMSGEMMGELDKGVFKK